MDTSRLLGGYLDTLAGRFPATKFVSIAGKQVRFLLTVYSRLS